MSVYRYMLYDLETGELKHSFATASTMEMVAADAINHRTGYVLGHWEPELCRVVDGQVRNRAGVTGEPTDFVFVPLPIEPSAPSASDVNAEAERRILARYPLWKQLNMIRDYGEGAATMAAYIDAVRAASDQIAADPAIADTFVSDARWPALEP